jgi:hypothetical protein
MKKPTTYIKKQIKKHKLKAYLKSYLDVFSDGFSSFRNGVSGEFSWKNELDS